MSGPSARKLSLVLLLGAFCLASGCGERAAAKQPSMAARREVAQRFAEAIFRGKADAAVALLVHPDDALLASLAARTAAPWRTNHAAVHLAGARSGGDWVFGYDGMHPQSHGAFEEVSGDLVVVVSTSPKGARVKFFTVRNRDVQFRTHHDSVLLPSNR